MQIPFCPCVATAAAQIPVGECGDTIRIDRARCAAGHIGNGLVAFQGTQRPPALRAWQVLAICPVCSVGMLNAYCVAVFSIPDEQAVGQVTDATLPEISAQSFS